MLKIPPLTLLPPLSLSPPFNTTWKNLFQYCLFSSLIPPFLISYLIIFFWTHSSYDYIAYVLIKHNPFQIIENEPDETLCVML